MNHHPNANEREIKIEKMLSLFTAVVCVVVSVLVLVVVRKTRTGWEYDKKLNREGLPLPPIAEGEVPVLGHALRYKHNPAKYITGVRAKLGDVFRINLAGLRISLIAGNADVMKQFALAKESELSSKEAVASFGFEKALGTLNVWEGTVRIVSLLLFVSVLGVHLVTAPFFFFHCFHFFHFFLFSFFLSFLCSSTRPSYLFCKAS